ncbi:hypothetical protein PR048_030535 [Dryococelus australis]|uniref:Uncharacterized protein n=1 Tax=Dryococelus australis TaxID=614101 RepID=A0ABQ9G994_9NEOP|nr:hypothetical protein PR048_030535 [Dryococelus australis]
MSDRKDCSNLKSKSAPFLARRVGRKPVQCWDTRNGYTQLARSAYLIISLWFSLSLRYLSLSTTGCRPVQLECAEDRLGQSVCGNRDARTPEGHLAENRSQEIEDGLLQQTPGEAACKNPFTSQRSGTWMPKRRPDIGHCKAGPDIFPRPARQQGRLQPWVCPPSGAIRIARYSLRHPDSVQRHDGTTPRVARRSGEALVVRVSAALIAPSLLDLGRYSELRTSSTERNLPADRRHSPLASQTMSNSPGGDLALDPPQASARSACNGGNYTPFRRPVVAHIFPPTYSRGGFSRDSPVFSTPCIPETLHAHLDLPIVGSRDTRIPPLSTSIAKAGFTRWKTSAKLARDVDLAREFLARDDVSVASHRRQQRSTCLPLAPPPPSLSFIIQPIKPCFAGEHVSRRTRALSAAGRNYARGCRVGGQRSPTGAHSAASGRSLLPSPTAVAAERRSPSYETRQTASASYKGASATRPSSYTRGATVAQRLACSPPTKANRVQSPAGSPDFRKWESCRTMTLVGVFSQGYPAPLPVPHSGAAPYSLKSPSSARKTSLLRAA